MPEITPNPYSPYADADPKCRHLIPCLFGLSPEPGVLALAACERMAVVPDGSLTDVTELLMAGRTENLPPGLCPACITVATCKGTPDRQPPATCRECDGGSSHGDLCALCRQDLHEQWWPTRSLATLQAANVAADRAPR
ncbi:hypothetical protein [Microtetraspora niveoalba]|uniref:hypothetical protein n=1 Tax=Microtetraspora niveoalba TaxID=46175 RepID=UPI000829E1E7|nr:hypothetical protein [Microtetraspora niveoalba]